MANTTIQGLIEVREVHGKYYYTRVDRGERGPWQVLLYIENLLFSCLDMWKYAQTIRMTMIGNIRID